VSSLRDLVGRRGRALLLPGAADALAARVIEAVGFEAVYVSGAGVTNAMLGLPDLAFLTLTELAAQVEAIRDAVEIPIVIDADTGFGGPLNVRRTVQALARRGADAIQLEDQESPKRCGHFDDKRVLPAQEMVAKIQAAVDARPSDRLLIVARTDALETEGLEAALDRASTYREAGADVTFVEAPRTRDELAAIGRLPGHQIVNVVEGGKTPVLPTQELEEMGFGIVLYANSALRGAIHGMRNVLEHLHRERSTLGTLDSLAGWEERQAIVRKDEFEWLARRYEPSATELRS
jgi:2-methylisocitrate lyase-like PEP mutase family enzyme